jgi:hypothetical protein
MFTLFTCTCRANVWNLGGLSTRARRLWKREIREFQLSAERSASVRGEDIDRVADSHGVEAHEYVRPSDINKNSEEEGEEGDDAS